MMTLELREQIVVLSLVHGKANAMDLDFCAEITERLDEARATRARAIVLTGVGRIFSAGVDMMHVLEGGASYVKRFVPALSDMLRAVYLFPRPLVAALNGHAVAGGCVLACAADWRIMARGEGRIGIPELQVGLPFPALALEVVRATVAPTHFARIVYDGETFPADEAVHLGLVDEVVAPGQLLDRALAVATRLGKLTPATFEITKRQMREPVMSQARASAGTWDAAVQRLWMAPESLDSVRAYVERTLGKKPG